MAAILLVVGNSLGPDARDQEIQGLLEDVGHTVTIRDDGTAENVFGFDGVVICESVSSGTIGSKYATVAIPVVNFEALNNDEFGIGTATLPSGSPTSIVILDDTHPFFDGPYGSFTGTVAVHGGARIGEFSSLASGAEALADVAAGASNEYCVVAVESGATLTSGTAPAKRAVLLFANSTGGTSALTTTGANIVKNAFDWAFGGGAPTAYSLDAQPGSFVLTGAPAGVVASRVLDAQPGSFAVTGFAAQTVRGFSLNAEPGSFIVTGAQAGLLADRVLRADPASFLLTGAQAGVVADRVLVAEPTSYAITGAPASVIAGRVLHAEPAVFVLTGADAGLVVDGGTLNHYVLNAEPGSFVLTGLDAGVAADRVLNAQPGNFAVTGTDATLALMRVLQADPGSFVVTGAPAGLIADRQLNAQPGSFTLTGSPAGVVADRVLSAEPGVFAVTGLPAGVLRDAVLIAEPGEFVLTGQVAGLVGPPSEGGERRKRTIVLRPFGIY